MAGSGLAIGAGFMRYAAAMMKKARIMYNTVFHDDGRPERMAMMMIKAPRIMIIWRFDIVLRLYPKVIG
jgi:hypothetical protein